MLIAQPELPVPLMAQFPFPAWATRLSEVVDPTFSNSASAARRPARLAISS